MNCVRVRVQSIDYAIVSYYAYIILIMNLFA